MSLMSFGVSALPLLPLPATSMNIINEITANNIKPIIKIFCFFISFSFLTLKSYPIIFEVTRKNY